MKSVHSTTDTASPAPASTETVKASAVASHTPTPWRFGPNAFGTIFIYTVARVEVAPTGFMAPTLICGGDGHRTLTEANAAFIVRAVNSHEALITALEKLEQQLAYGQINNAIMIVDDALAAARGET